MKTNVNDIRLSALLFDGRVELTNEDRRKAGADEPATGLTPLVTNSTANAETVSGELYPGRRN